MGKVKKLLKNNYKTIIYIFILAEWLCLNLYLLNMHYPWLDECHAWVMARDLSIKEMYNMLVQEGHPILWFLILMPAAKSGIGFGSMFFISFIFVGGALALLLFKTDFSIGEKLMIANSSMFIYYLPVVSRSYCLFPLFFILLYLLYEKRHETVWYPILIALMIQIHVYLLGFCMALFMLYTFEIIQDFKNNIGMRAKTKERKKEVLGILLITLSLILLVAELYLNPDRSDNVFSSGNVFTQFRDWLLDTDDLFIFKLTDSIFFIFRGFITHPRDYIVYLCQVRVITLAVFIIVNIMLYKTDKKIMFIFLISYVYLAIFCSIFYKINFSQKSVAIIFIMIFILSIILKRYKTLTRDGKKYALILRTGLFLLALASLNILIPQFDESSDIRHETNQNGYVIYKYLKNNLTDNDVIIFDKHIEVVSAYYKKKTNMMYNIEANKWQEFSWLSTENMTGVEFIKNTDFTDVFKKIKKERGEDVDFYFLALSNETGSFESNINNLPGYDFEIIDVGETHNTKFMNSNLVLYRIIEK